MGFLMARRAEGDQILGNVIAQSAPRLNVMDLKIFHSPARLTSPAVSLQDFAAELAISFRIKPQTGSLCSDPHQSIACTFSRSCLISRLWKTEDNPSQEGKRASRFPISELTPARKSAQIISKQ